MACHLLVSSVLPPVFVRSGECALESRRAPTSEVEWTTLGWLRASSEPQHLRTSLRACRPSNARNPADFEAGRAVTQAEAVSEQLNRASLGGRAARNPSFVALSTPYGLLNRKRRPFRGPSPWQARDATVRTRGGAALASHDPLAFAACPRPRREDRIHSVALSPLLLPGGVKGEPCAGSTSAAAQSSASSSASSPGAGPKGNRPASGEARAVPIAPAPVDTVQAGEASWRQLLEASLDEGLGAGNAQDLADRTDDMAESRDTMDEVQLATFLQSQLPGHPKLHRGVLCNGLKYIVLPNGVPPNRFEAHLEMHVGSVDEDEQEQGLAHLVEHVTFLGSRKREKLLGTGARSNAYTDFHHTVFHVHAPCTMQGSGEPMLPMVLEALHEIAFQPRFQLSRIDKERRAVLSEAQMMNTIEYRVDCQLLQYLHAENKIGSRFPIGKEEQVPHWSVDTIRAFHKRWYYPANATLYVVGDVGNVSQTIKLIEKEFSAIPPAYVESMDLPHFTGPSHVEAALATVQQQQEQENRPRKGRHALRPPVQHRWARQDEASQKAQAHAAQVAGAGSPVEPHPGLTHPTIFQHELLQNFALSVFCKTPVRPVRQFRDLRQALMCRIASYALQFRINKRYKSGEIPFLSISLDHSDSAREGCTVSTLTVVSEPQHWEGAVRLAVQEVRRLKEYGLTAGELTRYLTALMKDSEHVAAMIGSIPSLDNLDFIMENDALGHTIMDQEQAYECLSAVAPTVTLEDVNMMAAWVLEYVAEYGTPGAPQPAAIVACVPSRMHPLEGEALQDSNAGAAESIPFRIMPAQIQTALVEGLNEQLLPEPEVDVPRALLSDAMLGQLVQSVQPHFIPLPPPRTGFPLPCPGSTALEPAGGPAGSVQGSGKSWPLVLEDPDTHVVQRRLSNGIRLNMKVTQNEAMGGMIRLVVPGGRVEESPALPGAVAIGVRTLSESGSVGAFSLEQVELFCLANQINCALEADEEFVCMDFHFSSRHGGLRATFQLLHMVLQHSTWHDDALDRAKQLYLSHFRSLPKSLERYSAYNMLKAMFDNDPRLLEPSPEAISQLTLDNVRDAVLRQLLSGHMEVSVVGDFEVAEVEGLALQYLGTVTALPSLEEAAANAIVSRPIPFSERADAAIRHQKVFLKDTDERARAYIAGSAPNRWGFTADGRDVNTLMEPIPISVPEPTAAAERERENRGMLGRLIHGIFGGDASSDAKGAAASRALSTGALGALATVEQAKALAPLGVSVVEGPDGRLYWRKRRHPLFAATGLMLLTEIMNSRLFTTVRDALGLTYDVTFEVSTFDRIPMGWFVISVTSTPDKIAQAVEASINVLQGIQANRITQRELDRAKRTLLMRHESDLKDNGYWLGLLTHIQCDAVPRKDVGCIRDLPILYEAMTVDNIYAVYDQLFVDDKHLFTCIGTAGAGAGAVQVSPSSDDEAAVPDVYPGASVGRGTSMMTRPTA